MTKQFQTCTSLPFALTADSRMPKRSRQSLARAGKRGLTDNHYIVPGAEAVGEVLNNAWI